MVGEGDFWENFSIEGEISGIILKIDTTLKSLSNESMLEYANMRKR